MIHRFSENPILTKDQVPFDASLVFNAGVAKWGGRYVMLFRNDYGFDSRDATFEGTNLGVAFSADGIKWEVEREPCVVNPGPLIDPRDTSKIHRVYDPRLTVIDGRCYACLAVDTAYGICGAVAVTDDLRSLDILSISAPDNRNMVLFPEKVNGVFKRFERPMPIYGRGKPEAFDLWMADSPDLRYWGNHQCILGSEQVAYCNNKIGPGAPPIKTDRGWLALIHSVWKDDEQPLHGWELHPWTKQYSAALMLLDLDDPSKVLGISREPLLSPAETYEIEGFREAIFPTGAILEDNGEVKIYYGAADTVICLATAQLDDLLGCIVAL